MNEDAQFPQPRYAVWMSSTPKLISIAPIVVTALIESVRAGFPSPAEDLGASRINVLAQLILHPAATYSMTCEAVTRPSMWFVPIKSIEQQSRLFMHRAREGDVDQRSALINRIRGLLSELGIVMPLKAASDVSTTVIYTHFLKVVAGGVTSPLDSLLPTP